MVVQRPRRFVQAPLLGLDPEESDRGQGLVFRLAEGGQGAQEAMGLGETAGRFDLRAQRADPQERALAFLVAQLAGFLEEFDRPGSFLLRGAFDVLLGLVPGQLADAIGERLAGQQHERCERGQEETLISLITAPS
jgi:hypothetical protein